MAVWFSPLFTSHGKYSNNNGNELLDFLGSFQLRAGISGGSRARKIMARHGLRVRCAKGEVAGL